MRDSLCFRAVLRYTCDCTVLLGVWVLGFVVWRWRGGVGSGECEGEDKGSCYSSSSSSSSSYSSSIDDEDEDEDKDKDKDQPHQDEEPPSKQQNTDTVAQPPPHTLDSIQENIPVIHTLPSPLHLHQTSTPPIRPFSPKSTFFTRPSREKQYIHSDLPFRTGKPVDASSVGTAQGQSLGTGDTDGMEEALGAGTAGRSSAVMGVLNSGAVWRGRLDGLVIRTKRWVAGEGEAGVGALLPVGRSEG